jgi:predicted transcriptional regulator
MPRSTEPLGRLELEVLGYVAEQEGATVREVATHFAETSGHARTTLLTVMERLRAKGYLKRRKVDGVHRYTPTVDHEKVLARMVSEFVDDVLGGSVSPFVAYFSKSSHLSEAEARKLEDLLKRIEAREQREGEKS